MRLCHWYCILFLGLAGLAIPSSAAVFVGMTDTFEDGTTQGWGVGGPSPSPPETVGTGGPSGAGDSFLLLTSLGGAGFGSKLTVFNESQRWVGTTSQRA